MKKDFFWKQVMTEEFFIVKREQRNWKSLWTIYVECSPHYLHRVLGQLMIWKAFQLFSQWIGCLKKNAFIYWHNFGNRLVFNSTLLRLYVNFSCLKKIVQSAGVIKKMSKKFQVSAFYEIREWMLVALKNTISLT